MKIIEQSKPKFEVNRGRSKKKNEAAESKKTAKPRAKSADKESGKPAKEEMRSKQQRRSKTQHKSENGSSTSESEEDSEEDRQAMQAMLDFDKVFTSDKIRQDTMNIIESFHQSKIFFKQPLKRMLDQILLEKDPSLGITAVTVQYYAQIF